MDMSNLEMVNSPYQYMQVNDENSDRVSYLHE